MIDHYADVAAFNDACGCYRAPHFGAAIPHDVLAMRRRLIDEEYTELQKGLSDGCRVQIADACADLAYVCMGWLWATRHTYMNRIFSRASKSLAVGFVDTSYRAVMRTNESFFVDLLFDDSIQCGLAHGLPMDEVWAEVQRSNMSKISADGTVKRREDGKILKPLGWKPPDIRGVLERAGAL